jgi:hypothetical protein
VHVYENTPCVQVEPCRHGVDAHSSISVSQIAPLYPETHVHVYVSNDTDLSTDESAHVDPFMHGDDAHSSVSV